MRLLKISLVLLAAIACIAIARWQMTSVIDKNIADSRSTAAVIETTEAVRDVLPTIKEIDTSPAQSVADSSGMKTDYVPITGSGKVVEETAEAGNAASGKYDFPEKIYPYRAMLTDNQKLVYNQIYEAVDARTDSVALCTQLDKTGIYNVMAAIFADHPEFFWLDTAYSYGYTNKGAVVSVELMYNSTAETIQTSRTAFLNAASIIINNASQYPTDLEKERSVYLQLQNLAAYDEAAELNQSAYSALVNKSTVCAGYSRAFQYIMQKLNIPCYFCSGYANEGNHAWNIVKIDGKFYNVDLSWDDTLGEYSNDISYTYFNLSDNIMGIDHIRGELSKNLPACVSASPVE